MKRNLVPVHPIRGWRQANGFTPEQFAARIKEHGGQLTYRSLGEIELGRRHPSYFLAKAMVAAANDDITVDQLLTWRRPGKRGAA